MFCVVLFYLVNGCSIIDEYVCLDFVMSELLFCEVIDSVLVVMVEVVYLVLIDIMSDDVLWVRLDLVCIMSV